MSYKIERTNWRIEVTPYIDTRGLPLTAAQACDMMLTQIKRHVDGIETAVVTTDDRTVCEYCDTTWDHDNRGEPGCCDEANAEWSTDHPAPEQGGKK